MVYQFPSNSSYITTNRPVFFKNHKRSLLLGLIWRMANCTLLSLHVKFSGSKSNIVVTSNPDCRLNPAMNAGSPDALHLHFGLAGSHGNNSIPDSLSKPNGNSIPNLLITLLHCPRNDPVIRKLLNASILRNRQRPVLRRVTHHRSFLDRAGHDRR